MILKTPSVLPKTNGAILKSILLLTKLSNFSTPSAIYHNITTFLMITAPLPSRITKWYTPDEGNRRRIMLPSLTNCTVLTN